MIIRSNLPLSILLCFITVATLGQEAHPPALNIGDLAPQMQVSKWLKGTPVREFEKGSIYLVEFWATWCKPCKAAIPHLSALAAEYKGKVTILGIDVFEDKTTSLQKVQAFVDSMGNQMDYKVAADQNNKMVAGWLGAFGEQGIPKTFVVDAEGRVTWIGHPHGLAEVLPKIVSKTWDINEALAKRNLEKHLAELDDSVGYELMRYMGDEENGYRGKPDSALLVIEEAVRKEPKLEYASRIAAYTFSALLKTDLHKAFEYGKGVIAASTYEEPTYITIFGQIKDYSDLLTLPAEIYQLGAEAYQARIDAYPESADLPYCYSKMAEWYWRADDKSKAIAFQQKAIEALRSQNDFSSIKMAGFEFWLQRYANM
jgi:thiol-disulfide isomerase/thioredoxin